MKEIKLAANEQIMLSEKEMMQYVSLGRNTARDLMKKIGAMKKIGKRTLYYRPAIDAYFASCFDEAAAGADDEK